MFIRYNNFFTITMFLVFAIIFSGYKRASQKVISRFKRCDEDLFNIFFNHYLFSGILTFF